MLKQLLQFETIFNQLMVKFFTFLSAQFYIHLLFIEDFIFVLVKVFIDILPPGQIVKYEVKGNDKETVEVIDRTCSSILDVIWACCKQVASEILVSCVLANQRKLRDNSQVYKSKFKDTVFAWSCAYVFKLQVTMRVSKTMQLLKSMLQLNNHRQHKFHPLILACDSILPVK